MKYETHECTLHCRTHKLKKRSLIISNNPHASSEYSLGNVYEHRMLEEILSKDDNGGVFIDIGANFGNHSIFIAMFGRFERVVSIEPVPAFSRLVKANAILNGLSHVEVIDIGISRSGGEYSYHIRDQGNPGATSLIEGSGIKTVTLDSLNFTSVDVIKIDVEGMELDVLESGVGTLKECTPTLYVEAVESYDAVSSFLTSLGYMQVARFNATPTYRFVHSSKFKS
jgi:FkbM family methyltransferase